MRKALGQTSSSSFLFPFHFFSHFSQGLSSLRLFKEPLREVSWVLYGQVSFPLSVTQLVLTLGVGQRGVRPSGESLLNHSGYCCSSKAFTQVWEGILHIDNNPLF